MKANALSLLDIFATKQVLEVPIFQRRYVWRREPHWEQLWDDLERKFREFLAGRSDRPAHFLGALVLNQRQSTNVHVTRRLVIDGQQRLTTFQVLLAAYRDLCRQRDFPELADECATFTENTGMLGDPARERLKVAPSNADRAAFAAVMLRLGDRERPADLHTSLISQAYGYFAHRFRTLVDDTAANAEHGAYGSLRERLLAIFSALQQGLKVVVIDLEAEDDPQVIFETLNGRGEPLLPLDLIRNFIFMRAAQQGEDLEALYHRSWSTFDDGFWSQDVPSGKLTRPRSDLFLQNVLASRLATDVPVRQLFAQYRYWRDQAKPPFARDELASLARSAVQYRRLAEPSEGDVVYPLATFLRTFAVDTIYPLLLLLLESELDAMQWRTTALILQSYIVRRFVCDLDPRSYAQTFLTATRALRMGTPGPRALFEFLREQQTDLTEWPNDRMFREGWQQLTYAPAHAARFEYLLTALNDAYQNSNAEARGHRSIDHVLPQTPTPAAAADDPSGWIGRRREALVQSVGNLILVPSPSGLAHTNGDWEARRRELREYARLNLARTYEEDEFWDESAIERRTSDLFETALGVWPGPQSSSFYDLD